MWHSIQSFTAENIKLECFSYPKAAEANKKIWTTGCVEEVRVFLERNLYTIACVALGVALAQVKYSFFPNQLHTKCTFLTASCNLLVEDPGGPDRLAEGTLENMRRDCDDPAVVHYLSVGVMLNSKMRRRWDHAMRFGDCLLN